MKQPRVNTISLLWLFICVIVLMCLGGCNTKSPDAEATREGKTATASPDPSEVDSDRANQRSSMESFYSAYQDNGFSCK